MKQKECVHSVVCTIPTYSSVGAEPRAHQLSERNAPPALHISAAMGRQPEIGFALV